MFGILDWFRRRRARAQPFPETWRALLRADVPFYPRLGDAARARFEERLKIFVLTKAFVPANGMVVDERVKVVIGAAAARLTMNLRGHWYHRLTEVVVYPTHYVHPDKGGVVFGEAHHFGTVVLSWDAVIGGMKNPEDGHDTALHEFAHVLDVADGSFDGTPPLAMAAYSPWARVMSREFLHLRGRTGKQKRSVMRRYGATNEAEFFAVATETFFEKPRQMKKKHPELYALLVEYYKCDPAADEAASESAEDAAAAK